jgi:hypothetical protein
VSASGVSDARAEPHEACHDDGEDGMEGDVLLVDDPVERKPQEAGRGPGRGGEPRLAVPEADHDAGCDRAKECDGEEPLVAERAEDERVDSRYSG